MVPKLVRECNRELEPGEFLRGGCVRVRSRQTGNYDRVLPCLSAWIDDEDLGFLRFGRIQRTERSGRTGWSEQGEEVSRVGRVVGSVHIEAEGLIGRDSKFELVVAEGVCGDQGMHWKNLRSRGTFVA